MEDLLDSIRRIITRWAITTTKLTADAHVGDTTLTVRTTRRFEPGSQLLIRDADENIEASLTVEEVPDDFTIVLSSPLQFDWTVANDAAVVKTLHDNFVKAVFIGEPDVITDFPAITVNGTTRSSEWYTTRITKERFNIEIGIFIQDDTQEKGYRFLLALTDLIQRGLKHNIYPLANDYVETTLLSDVQIGDEYIKVPDTSMFRCGRLINIESPWDAEEFSIKEIVDSTTLRVQTVSDFNFPVADSKVIILNRFVYNSWPAEINYGKIHKGTLLKSAVISFFCEESEQQLQGGWDDPQLA